MAIMRFDPLSRSFLRSFFTWEDEEEMPELKMTEGLDIYEEDDKIYVKAVVPGVPAERVDVTFEDGVLRIRAKVEDKKEEKEKKRVVYRMDRVASFDYTATIPRPIEEDTLEAKVENGVVVVSAKIAEAAKAKKIPVKTK